MPKVQFSVRVEEDKMDYLDQLTEELGIAKTSFAEFAINLMEAYFTIEQLKSEVIAHGPKDHRRKE